MEEGPGILRTRDARRGCPLQFRASTGANRYRRRPVNREHPREPYLLDVESSFSHEIAGRFSVASPLGFLFFRRCWEVDPVAARRCRRSKRKPTGATAASERSAGTDASAPSQLSIFIFFGADAGEWFRMKTRRWRVFQALPGGAGSRVAGASAASA